MADKTLTPRQERFVQEYLVDLNATQAAIRAGYSVKTARQVASENLTKPNVQAAIEARRQVRAARAELSQDWVLRRLRIEATRKEEGASHSARVSALKLLGQHMGMFKEKLELSGSVGGMGRGATVEDMTSEQLERIARESDPSAGSTGVAPEAGGDE